MAVVSFQIVALWLVAVCQLARAHTTYLCNAVAADGKSVQLLAATYHHDGPISGGALLTGSNGMIRPTIIYQQMCVRVSSGKTVRYDFTARTYDTSYPPELSVCHLHTHQRTDRKPHDSQRLLRCRRQL